MPIRPEYRHFYAGEAWRRLRERVLRRAGNCCERCGVPNGQIYMRHVQQSKSAPTEARVVLSVAHLDHNPAHMRLSNLKALCQRCHLRHDLAQHVQSRRANRAKKMGLLRLFEGF